MAEYKVSLHIGAALDASFRSTLNAVEQNAKVTADKAAQSFKRVGDSASKAADQVKNDWRSTATAAEQANQKATAAAAKSAAAQKNLSQQTTEDGRKAAQQRRQEAAEEARQAQRNAQEATQNLHRVQQLRKDSQQDISRGLLLAGTGLTAALGATVAVTARFDQQLSAARGVIGGSTEDFRHLRDAVLDAGQATVFSATEAAKGATELGRAGLGIRDIINGGLVGSLNLAAAGQIGLAEASEITASTLNVFGLKGFQASHVADLLAAGANAAQGGVHDMSYALSQSSLVANQFGLSVEDTIGSLTLFASKGLIGSDAGTSFRTMLLRLNPQSLEAGRAMKQLGLDFYDANGNFIGIAATAGQLQEKLKDLSEEQRTAALNTIFGQDAIRAATILYREGAIGVEKYVKEVNDTGAASRLAATNMDNLSGDLEKLKGSFEVALIKTGDNATGGLRQLVQVTDQLVSGYGELPPVLQAAGGGLTTVAAGTTLALGAAGLAIPKYQQLKDTLETMGQTGQRLGTAMKFASIGIGVAAIAATAALAVYSIYAERKAKAEQVTRSFAQALEAEKTGQYGAADAQILTDLANKKALDSIQKLGIGQLQFNEALQGNAQAQAEVRQSILATTPGINQSAEGLKALDGALRGNASAQTRFTQLNWDLVKQNPQVVQGIIKVGDAYKDLSPSYRKAAEDSQKYATAQDDVRNTAYGMAASQGAAGAAAEQMAVRAGAESDELSKLASSLNLTRGELLAFGGQSVETAQEIGKGLQEQIKALGATFESFGSAKSVFAEADQTIQDAAREAQSAVSSGNKEVLQQKKSDLAANQKTELEALRSQKDNVANRKAGGTSAIQNEVEILQAKQKVQRQELDSEIKHAGSIKDVQKKSVDDLHAGFEQYAALFKQKNDQLAGYQTNITAIAGKYGEDVAVELSKAGPEAAGAIEGLAKSSGPAQEKFVAEVRRKMKLDLLAKDISGSMALASVAAGRGADQIGLAAIKALVNNAGGLTEAAQRYAIDLTGIADDVHAQLGYTRFGNVIITKEQAAGTTKALQDYSQNAKTRKFAEGGFENHVAEIARGQTPVRVWAEPETGGEAYIPLADHKSQRSEEIWRQVGAQKGWQFGPFQHFAAGGFSGRLPKPPTFGSYPAAIPTETVSAALYDIVGDAIEGIPGRVAAGAGVADPASTGKIGSGWQSVVAYLKSVGTPYTVTSTTGGKHAVGSYHYQGKAVDLVSGNMMQIFNTLSQAAGTLTELFYTPAGYSIKNGKKVSPIAAADHYDHVHAATYDRGGYLEPGYTIAYNGTNKRETVITSNDMRELITAVKESKGGASITVNGDSKSVVAIARETADRLR